MKRTIVLSRIVTGLTLISSFCAQKPETPSAEIIGRVRGSAIDFQVRIPEGHHAYLDEGREGNLLKIQFDFNAGSTGGAEEPKLKSSPKGTYDSTAEATVLRGTGTFTFEVASADNFAGRKARVRTQLCDDIRGLCYPPKFSDIEIHAGT